MYHLQTNWYHLQHCMCECLLHHLEKSEPFQGSQLLLLSKMQHQPGDNGQNDCLVLEKWLQQADKCALRRWQPKSTRLLNQQDLLEDTSGRPSRVSMYQPEFESYTDSTRKSWQISDIPTSLLIHANLQIAQNRSGVKLNSIKFLLHIQKTWQPVWEARRWSQYPRRFERLCECCKMWLYVKYRSNHSFHKSKYSKKLRISRTNEEHFNPKHVT